MFSEQKAMGLIVFTNSDDRHLRRMFRHLHQDDEIQGASLLVTSERTRRMSGFDEQSVTPAGCLTTRWRQQPLPFHFDHLCDIVRHRRRAMSASSGCASALDR